MMRQHELIKSLRFEESANGNKHKHDAYFNSDTHRELVESTDTESAREFIDECLLLAGNTTDAALRQAVRVELDYMSFSTNVIHDAMDYLDRMLRREAAYAIAS